MRWLRTFSVVQRHILRPSTHRSASSICASFKARRSISRTLFRREMTTLCTEARFICKNKKDKKKVTCEGCAVHGRVSETMDVGPVK